MGDNNDGTELITINISLPFPNDRIAEIVYHSLRVDKEPKRSGVEKSLTIEDNLVNVILKGNTAKQVKIASDNYFKNVQLVLDTIEYLGEPKSDKYSHFS